MAITGFGPPLMRRWRMDPHEEPPDEFIERCLKLWDQGLDTKDISVVVDQREAVAAAAVRLGRERRREKEDRDEKGF